ncbi:HAD family hydrolase [Cellulomonas aerilata]|uniref:Haloacid dehalogenase n=1 Tax=Cellulomonas aerilata TaxID=515326 RepID=A0A512DF98_9CELL|nr:haloacid dehalogenase-like hydrolase [Cellulomonas aerilata]GEO35153.1 haloacid dehalogenase [Cellulomonas aerilata]
MQATTGPALLLWDVDHTLIENAGVSKENYALAFELLTGRPATHKATTGGRTDVVIIEDLLRSHGIDPSGYTSEERYAALVEAGRRNRSRLQERGHALPGAAECLVRLASEAGVRQSVLTGNVEPNARVKLGAFDLDEWLDFSVGAFGEEHTVRSRLVPVAQAKARDAFGFDPARDVTIVIGDTKLDVEAGLEGGARVIAVATGGSSFEELRTAGADAVLGDLTDVDALIDAVHELIHMGATGPRAYEPAG